MKEIGIQLGFTNVSEDYAKFDRQAERAQEAQEFRRAIAVEITGFPDLINPTWTRLARFDQQRLQEWYSSGVGLEDPS